jgi:membrane protease YdiL (CAAX protease family)
VGRSDVKGERLSSCSRPNERALPRWATAAVVVYLSVTVTVVVAALLTNGLELDVDARTKEGLLLAMVFLTLPVSAAYFVIGTFGSGRPPSPEEISLGGLSLTAVLYYLGYVFLAAVNAGVFRWIVLSARRVTPVPAAGTPGAPAQYPRVTLRGVTPDVRKLWWAVPCRWQFF